MAGVFGKEATGGLNFPAITADQKRVWGPYSILEAGTITKLTMHVKGGASSQVVKAVVYSDSAGSPGALLGTGSEMTIGASQVEGNMDFTGLSVHLNANDRVWLGIHSGATTGSYFWYDLGASNAQKLNTDTYSDGATDPFGTASNDNGDATIFATYTPDATDSTSPTVSITSPAAGNVSGTVTITATLTDNVGIRKAEFLVDGNIIATKYVSPWTTTFDTRAFLNGASIQVQVRATDPQGNQTTGSVSVTANNPYPAGIETLSTSHFDKIGISEEIIHAATINDLARIVNQLQRESPRVFNVQDPAYGAKGDGEVNPVTGSVTGTDDTGSFQAACDDAKASGGGIVYVPHAGLSQYKHGDGTLLDRGYLISTGNISVPHGVSIFGAQGRGGGAQSSDTAGGWCTELANEIPPSAQPTILLTNTTNPGFKSGGTGGTIKNLNFLWPSQVNHKYEWGGTSKDITQLVVYPAAIKVTHADWTLENLTDYNSYIFIDWSCPTKGRIYDIESASHKSVITSSAGANEWHIDGIEYNNGTVYNGHIGWGIGPILDLVNSGPSFLSHVASNREWVNDTSVTMGPTIKLRTSAFGITLDDVWIDTDPSDDAVISITQNAAAAGNAVGLSFLNNVLVTRGCTAPYSLKINYPDGNLGGGANEIMFKISNSDFFGQPVKLMGGGSYLFSNVTANGMFLNGVATSSNLGQRIQLSNCNLHAPTGVPAGGALTSIGGKNFVQMSNMSTEQYNQAIYCKRDGVSKGNVTITIASPAVVTTSAIHALDVGDPVVFSTTGALPTGLTAGTTYYVSQVVTRTTFKVATSFANAQSGTHINTSGTQSGVHSLNTDPGTMRVAYLDGLKTLEFVIPAGTVLATGETVIGQEFITTPNTVRSGPQAYEFTVMSAEGTGANGDQWKIRRTIGGAENAVLFTTNVIQLHAAGAQTYAGWARSSTDGLQWFNAMADPPFTFDASAGGSGVQPFEIRYINNTGNPVTVPAGGYHLILVYCCM